MNKKNIVVRLFRKLRSIYSPARSPEQLMEIKKKSDYDFLIARGVETEYGYVTLVGEPIIQKAEGSRIIIGKGVTLVSSQDANVAGINHPCILSTQRSGAELVIGEGCGFSGSSIVSFNRIEIGRNFGGGVNSSIYDGDFHGLKAKDRCSSECVKSAPVIIGDDVWMAANSMILKGVTVGNRVVIGAMSLVTHDIPDDCLVVGNPARIIKTIDNE